MTIHDFLLKYGTRMVSMALRQCKEPYAKEMADDLQAAFEHWITHDDLRSLSVREAMGGQDAAE